MHNIYKIEGSFYINAPTDYSNENLFPDFQNQLEHFKSNLINQVKGGQGVSYYKFGDGDYFFLRKEGKGSAKPGNRALRELIIGNSLKDLKKMITLCVS